jgi:alanine racemase
MSFTLYVDESRWRAHLAATVAATPGIVPVIKGNGYGLGNQRLAAEAALLGVDTVAVGTADELPAVTSAFPGDVLVLTPSYPRPFDDPTGRVVQTAAHLETLRAGDGARVLVEALTSMHRHGLDAGQLPALAAALTDVRLEGLAFHLPMDRHGGYDPAAEVDGWLRRFAAAGVPTGTAWISHLRAAELDRLRSAFPATTFRPRIGTSLWLGDRGALVARGTVLDVHQLERGTHYGYRRRRAARDSHLVVVSGGTAHGVALEAPRTVRGPAGRGKALAVGTLAAANLSLSPFRWAGKQRWFAEPPHMHVSLLLVPASVDPPAIGTELDCDVRMTTLHPDAVAPLPPPST